MPNFSNIVNKYFHLPLYSKSLTSHPFIVMTHISLLTVGAILMNQTLMVIFTLVHIFPRHFLQQNGTMKSMTENFLQLSLLLTNSVNSYEAPLTPSPSSLITKISLTSKIPENYLVDRLIEHCFARFQHPLANYAGYMDGNC